MRKRWLILSCAALICGGAGWQIYSRVASQRKLAAVAQATQVRAERGDAQAQYELAMMYLRGEGVPKDVGTAQKWIRSAAKQGLAKADSVLGSWCLYGVGLPQNDSEAFQLYRSAAEKGDAAGEYGVGYMYRNGRGAAKNIDEANDWTRKSAEHGYAIAQSELGYMYSKGQGVPQDYSKSAYWYRKAAEQGLAKAQSAIGYLEIYGYGIQRNRIEANIWFHKAAAQGDAYAKDTLSLIWLGMSGFDLAIVGVQLLSGTMLLAGDFMSRGWRSPIRSGRAMWAGILCVISGGASWFGFTSLLVWSSVHIVILFRIFKLLLDLVLVIFLIAVLRGDRTERSESSPR